MSRYRPRRSLRPTRGVERDWDPKTLVEDADYDGIHPRSDENERVVETNVLRRVGGPGGPEGDQEAMGDVEDDWDRQDDAEGVGCDGNGGRKGGATSAAHRNSKRVKTDVLAAYQGNQHEQRQRTTSDVPEPSNPPPNYPRRPYTHPNPPRRRGRLKTRPTSVSYPERPTRPSRRVEAKSGKSDAPGMLYMDRRWCRSDPRSRYAKTRPLESIEDERATIAEPRLSISGNRASAARRDLTTTDYDSFVYSCFHNDRPKHEKYTHRLSRNLNLQ